MNKFIIYSLVLCVFLSHFRANAQSPIDFSKLDQSKITSDDAVTWRQFGPGGSGNNYYLYWHPTDPNTVFQGPNMLNAYRSTDQGKTYEGILDYDGSGYKLDERGPIEITTPDFSYQNPKIGFCSREGRSYLFKTSNKGATWQRDKTSEAVFHGQLLNTIEVDPINDDIWFIGSGTNRDSNHYFYSEAKPHGYSSSPLADNHEAKIWKTNNQGSSWIDVTPSGLNSKAQITRILVDPGNHNTIFAATTYGFYKSSNGGSSWTVDLNSGLDNNIIRSMDMHYDATTNKVTLYAIDLVKYIPDGNTVTYNGGIFKSTNEGGSWTKINNNMPLPKTILEDYTVKKLLYKLALGKWFGISESAAQSTYSLPDELLHSVSMIRVNPTDPDNVLVLNNYKSQFTFSGGMMWRTNNGGQSWFVTFRNGKHWKDKHKTIWQGRNNPVSHNVSFRAQHEWELRDNYDRKAGATVEFNSDGSKIMFQVAKVVCISDDNGNTWVENDEVDASTDGSEHWVGAGNSNMPGSDIVQDERLDHIYFCAGENSIFRSTKDGGNVRPLAQAVYKINIPNKASPEECSVSTIVLDPNDVNTMYSVHFRQKYQGMLMKTTDGGDNWEEHGKIVDFPLNDYNAKIHQSSLIIDPDNTDNFYVCIPSKPVDDMVKVDIGDITDPFGVYKSTDGGVTFSQINNGFESVVNKKLNVLKMRLDPKASGVLYAAVNGASGGLYKLAKNSNTWKKVNSPTGVTDVNDLFITNDKLYIACGNVSNTDTSVGGVFESSDRGVTWTHKFKSRNANHIRVATYDQNVVMVAIPSTNMLNPGVYRSLDGGSNWAKLNTGNPQSDRIADLEIDLKQKGVYWVSSYGSGFYKGIDSEIVNNGTEISSINAPSVISKGEEVRVSVSYKANEEVDLYFRLVQKSPWVVVSELKKSSVAIGTGTKGVDFTVPITISSEKHVWQVGIVPAGGSWSSKITQESVDVEVTKAAGNDIVSLQNVGSTKYVTYDSASSILSCNKTSVGANEKFEWIDLGSGEIALKASNGLYVSSENGTKTTTCNRSEIGAWETFTLIDHGDDTFTIVGNNDLNLGGGMLFNKTNTGSWQQFKVTKIGTVSAKSNAKQSIDEVVVVEEEFELSIYPNPVRNRKITIEVNKEIGNVELYIFRINGQQIHHSILSSRITKLELDSLVKGMYLMKVINGQNIYNQKLIVE